MTYLGTCVVSCNKLPCRTLHQDLLVTCQQPLISSFPASSPTVVEPEPTTPSGGSGTAIAGILAALVVTLIVIISVVVIAYFLYK